MVFRSGQARESLSQGAVALRRVQVSSAQSDVDGDEPQSSLSVSATVEFDTVIQGTDGQNPLLSLIAAFCAVRHWT
jgi:hypothetical protein